MDNVTRAAFVTTTDPNKASALADVQDADQLSGQISGFVAEDDEELAGLLADPALSARIIPTADFNTPHDTAVTLHHGSGDWPVVASCPHAGRGYPAEFLHESQLPIDGLRGLEDFGVDCLLLGFTKQGIACVNSHIARAYLDVNRPADALDHAMFDGPVGAATPSRHVRAGYGLMPRLTAERRTIYHSRLAASIAARRIAAVHSPYHALLTSEMSATSQRHGYALLIDFHSMPQNDRANRPLPDIVLGDCNGMTLDRRVGLSIGDFFSNAGLSVAWNHPYAGGFITRSNGALNSCKQSLQIEINRRLYMQNDGQMDVKRTIDMAQLLGDFAAYLQQMHRDGLLRS